MNLLLKILECAILKQYKKESTIKNKDQGIKNGKKMVMGYYGTCNEGR